MAPRIEPQWFWGPKDAINKQQLKNRGNLIRFGHTGALIFFLEKDIIQGVFPSCKNWPISQKGWWDDIVTFSSNSDGESCSVLTCWFWKASEESPRERWQESQAMWWEGRHARSWRALLLLQPSYILSWDLWRRLVGQFHPSIHPYLEQIWKLLSGVKAAKGV